MSTEVVVPAPERYSVVKAGLIDAEAYKQYQIQRRRENQNRFYQANKERILKRKHELKKPGIKEVKRRVLNGEELEKILI